MAAPQLGELEPTSLEPSSVTTPPAPKVQLYLPEKYKVVLGKGRSIGFCTVWSDPEIIIKLRPELLEKCAIIGTLYSREGVNIMLRNLCLNPQINHVIVWGKQPMSRTPIGKSGTDVLNQIWNSGVKEDGTAGDFKIHPNMDAAVVNNVVQNVKIIDASEVDLSKIPEAIAAIEPVASQEPYMAPASFPIYQREASEKLPSEEVGWVVHGRKIADVFVRALDRIMRYGTEKTDEYGTRIKEVTALTWVIDDDSASDPYIPEDWPSDLRATTGAAADHIKKYVASVFMTKLLPPGSVYSYGHRLRAYPIAEGKTVDQVQFIINKFKECETTRRAVAVMWHPGLDHGKDSPACITQIQAIQNEGRLNLYAVIRSHDHFKADIPNGFGLRAIQEEIAKALGLKVGKLSVTINSAHIYEEDWDSARMLVKCAIWDRPVKAPWFDEKTDADPRGNILVSIAKDGRIIADLISPKGEPLMSLEGRSAIEVSKKIAQLDLLSKPFHMMDIGAELQKAEIARDLGIEYKQDRPLELRKPKK